MIGENVETVFIVGDRVFVLGVSQNSAPRSMVVTVTMDGRYQWSFDEPGWRPLAFGSFQQLPYVWSARALITLPSSASDEPDVIRVDEDLLYAFRSDGGWLLVCETSVRCHVGGKETDRLELGDIVERATWDNRVLWLLDVAGQEHRIRVEETRLSI